MSLKRNEMKKQKEKRENPFKFMVRGRNRKWSAWTGAFESKEDAMVWFEKHGQFHLDNSHTLGLFCKAKLLKIFEPK